MLNHNRKMIIFFVIILLSFIFINDNDDTQFIDRSVAFNKNKAVGENRNIAPSAIGQGTVQAKDNNLESKTTQKKDYSKLKNSIKTYLKDKNGDYGVYFISLANGGSFGINEKKEFPAASTVKLPVNMYLFNKFALGEEKPEDEVTYLEDDYEEGTGVLQDDDIGSSFTLGELSKLSIEVSDNVAINMLIRHLNRDKIYDYQEKIVGHSLKREGNVSTPKDMALYLKALLSFEKKHPNEGVQLLIFLENTEFNDRIPVYLPEDIKVAHKIGNGESTQNDVGIVFADKPYIVTFMTDNIDEGEADDAIGTISKMIYDYEQENG